VRPKTTGTCSSGKLRYADGYTAQLALDVAREARTRHANPRVECRTYECPACHGFHLTSQPLKTELSSAVRRPLVLEVHP
jgi:hypothetical protein